jgi:DNA-directed RNA polymerase subunit RPC12/RpoP
LRIALESNYQLVCECDEAEVNTLRPKGEGPSGCICPSEKIRDELASSMPAVKHGHGQREQEQAIGTFSLRRLLPPLSTLPTCQDTVKAARVFRQLLLLDTARAVKEVKADTVLLRSIALSNISVPVCIVCFFFGADGVLNECGTDCGADNPLRANEPIRCKECGHRVMYKKRVKVKQTLSFSLQILAWLIAVCFNIIALDMCREVRFCC